MPTTVPASPNAIYKVQSERVGLVEVSSAAERTKWDSGAQFSPASRASGLMSSETSGFEGAMPMMDSDGPEEHELDVGSSRGSHNVNSGPDTDSVEWIFADNGSVASGEDEPESIEEPFGVDEFRGIPAGVRDALRWLDGVDLNVVFHSKANVIKSVPNFLKGPFRNDMKVLIEEIVAGHEGYERMREERVWKGFLLLLWLLLHRKCRGGKIAKDKLKERFDLFQSGRWEQLLGSSVAFDEEASIQSTGKRRTQNQGDLEHRVNRHAFRWVG